MVYAGIRLPLQLGGSAPKIWAGRADTRAGCGYDEITSTWAARKPAGKGVANRGGLM